MEQNVFKHSVRLCMPETNSSSCHSITIFGSPDAKKADLPKYWFKSTNAPDDTLIIHGGESFGRENRDITCVEEKIQYACTGVWWGYTGELISEKRKEMLEKVLKDYLGVSFIEYAWDDPEKLEKWSEEHPDDLIDECPDRVYGDSPNEIDHESTDVHDQIYESESSLRDFIFSSLSVAACGECDVTEPQQLYPAMNKLGKGLVLRYSTKINIFLSSDQGPDSLNEFDLLILPGFPYLRGLDTNLSKECVIWTGLREKQWRHYGKEYIDNYLLYYYYNDSSQLIAPESIQLLDSIKIVKGAKTYIKIDGKARSERLEQWIPVLLPETFKYPFPLYFFPASIIQDTKLLETLQPGYDSPLNVEIVTEWLQTNFGKTPMKLIPEIIYNGHDCSIPDKI